MNYRKPKIRFPEFNDDWEQRKLGEWCNFINGDRSSNYPSTTEFVKYGIPFVGSDSLGSTLVDKTKLRFITSEKYEQMNGLKIEKNDILYTLRGAGFGKCSIADFTEGTVASSLVGIRCTESLRAKFLIQWLSSRNAENEKNKAVNGSTAQNISVEDMKKYCISVPCIAEQDKISEHLYNLDNLITIHQRKCDYLKELKKGLLQKMFPKRGASVPEIRFPGYTDDWEQRKLSEVATFIRGSFPQPYTNPDYYDENNGKPFVQVGDIGMDLLLNDDTKAHISSIAESKSRFVKAGTVIVALQGSIEKSIGRTAITQYDAFVDRTILIFESYKIPIDKLFFAQIIKALFEIEKEKAWGATISTITKDYLSDFVIGVPSIDEQKKIGAFFKQLDNLITLHQYKCDEMKEYKKGLLQKMFI